MPSPRSTRTGFRPSISGIQPVRGPEQVRRLHAEKHRLALRTIVLDEEVVSAPVDPEPTIPGGSGHHHRQNFHRGGKHQTLAVLLRAGALPAGLGVSSRTAKTIGPDSWGPNKHRRRAGGPPVVAFIPRRFWRYMVLSYGLFGRVSRTFALIPQRGAHLRAA